MIRSLDHGADCGHLPAEELEARYRSARNATEARHYQAIWLLAQGRTVLEAAEVLAFVPRWVEELAARYNKLRSRGAGRPAAAERPERQPADPGPAGRLGRAAAGAAGGWRGVERPEGRRLDGAASRAGEGASPARLGGAEAAGVVGPDTAAAPSARGNVRRPGSAQKKLGRQSWLAWCVEGWSSIAPGGAEWPGYRRGHGRSGSACWSRRGRPVRAAAATCDCATRTAATW